MIWGLNPPKFYTKRNNNNNNNKKGLSRFFEEFIFNTMHLEWHLVHIIYYIELVLIIYMSLESIVVGKTALPFLPTHTAPLSSL